MDCQRGTLLGNLKTAFLSSDPDPSHKGSDVLYIDPLSDLKSWLNLGPEDVLRLRKAVYGLINAPLRWHQRLSRALRQAGFVSLQVDPCVWILPTPSPVKNVSSVDVPTKFRTAVLIPPCHLLVEFESIIGNDREVFKACWEYMLMIWLVVEISLFRQLCDGFGLSLSLEPGITVDFDFVVEN